VQVLHEILRCLLATAALIVEADHVAQGVIAEDDAQLVVAFLDAVGPIQVARIANVPLRVAAHETLRR